MKETTIKAKCNASNKHTTGVYTSFFKQRSDLRWTQKKTKKELASDLMRKTTALRALQRVLVEQTIALLRFWGKKPSIKSALVTTRAQQMCMCCSSRQNANCIEQ